MIGRAGGGFPECVVGEGVLSIENQLFSQKTGAQISLPNYLIARHCQSSSGCQKRAATEICDFFTKDSLVFYHCDNYHGNLCLRAHTFAASSSTTQKIDNQWQL
jgi:hypothetical protein